ncbi:MAG: DUF7311 family protein [Halobacteriota archaeon]
MSVRVLLAVVLAAALIGAAIPAIHEAQAARADQQLSGSVDRLTAGASELSRHSDPVTPGVPGARRQVSVTIPPKPAGVSLTIEPDSGNGTATVLRTSVPGEPDSITHLSMPVRPVGTERTVRWNDTLVLEDSSELTLRYRLVDGRPVVTVARGFK